MNQTLHLDGARRPRVPVDVEDKVRRFWFRQCERYYNIDELGGEDTLVYYLYRTDEACWLHYQAEMVAEYAGELRDLRGALDDVLDGGDGDTYDAFRQLMQLDQRLVVGRTKFFDLKPAEIQRGPDRTAGCPDCRRYAAASNDVNKYIDPELHKNCPNPTDCRRRLNCQMVADLEAAGLPDGAAEALRTLRDLQDERDKHKRLRDEQNKFVAEKMDSLADDEAFVFMDWSPLHGGYGAWTTLGEGMGKHQALYGDGLLPQRR